MEIWSCFSQCEGSIKYKGQGMGRPNICTPDNAVVGEWERSQTFGQDCFRFQWSGGLPAVPNMSACARTLKDIWSTLTPGGYLPSSCLHPYLLACQPTCFSHPFWLPVCTSVLLATFFYCFQPFLQQVGVPNFHPCFPSPSSFFLYFIFCLSSSVSVT